MRPSIPILLLLSALWIICGTYFLSNSPCGAGGGAPLFSVHDGAFKSSANDVASFGFNSTALTSSKEVNKVFKDVAGHLTKNEGKQLTLFGLYSSNETNDKVEDLGLARAEKVKQQIINMGKLSEEVAANIVTQSRRVDNYHSSSKAVNNSVDFVFSDGGADGSTGDAGTNGAAAVTDIEDMGSSKMILNFDIGQTDASKTSELEQYMYTLREYLNNNPGAKIVVTGFTDDQGNSSELRALSRDRAKKVRRLFRSDDLFASKEVVAEGKGKADPIASNDDEDGRRTNNRVEITIER